MSYKSSFQDRAAQAGQAKEKALEQLRGKPTEDAAAAAERKTAEREREAAKTEKAASKKAEKKQAAEAAAKDVAASAAAALPKSAEELKAARDARYAKRKAKK